MILIDDHFMDPQYNTTYSNRLCLLSLFGPSYLWMSSIGSFTSSTVTLVTVSLLPIVLATVVILENHLQYLHFVSCNNIFSSSYSTITDHATSMNTFLGALDTLWLLICVSRSGVGKSSMTLLLPPLN